jgi:molybdopterin synthase catalytic subunit
VADRAFTRITTEPLDEAVLREFVGTPASGAIVVFSGVVRDHHQGKGVARIQYWSAEELARNKLRDLTDDVARNPNIDRVAAVHRLGLVEVGEASVIVAASAAHRDDAFFAARRLIDRIKEVLPIWKHEQFTDGTAAWAPGFEVPEGERGPGVPPGVEAR